MIYREKLMAAPEPSPEPLRSPHQEAASTDASREEPRQENEEDGLKDPDDMTLDEFLEDVYYNPFGPPPGGVD